MKDKKPYFCSADKFSEIENRKKYQFLWFKTTKPESKAHQKIIKADTIYQAIDKFLGWRNTPKRCEKVIRVDYEVYVEGHTYVDITESKLSFLI